MKVEARGVSGGVKGGRGWVRVGIREEEEEECLPSCRVCGCGVGEAASNASTCLE